MKIPSWAHTGAIVLAGVGALNWGLNEFLKFNLLKFIPAGLFTTIVVALIAASGAYVLYALYDKKI